MNALLPDFKITSSKLSGVNSTAADETPTTAPSRANVRIMARIVALLGLVGAASAAIELTPDNFDAEVFKAGKSAFVKFLAPW